MNRILISTAVFVAVAAGGFAQDSEETAAAPLPRGVMGEVGFFVEEFVPNRLKVETSAPVVRSATTAPLTVQVRAEEMFGQAAAGRAVSGAVTFSAAPFAPKGWDDYTFGDAEIKFSKRDVELDELQTGEDGRVDLEVPLPDSPTPAAIRAVVQATVKEQGRGVTSRLERVIDPVPYYLGLKSAAETFLRPGREGQFDLAAVAPAGEVAAIDSQVTGSISRVIWNSILQTNDIGIYSFKTSRQLEPVQQIDVRLAGGRAQVAWTPPASGQYLLRLFDAGSSASVSLQFYVSDTAMTDQPWPLDKPERVELALDKPEYRVGETARVLIKAPFAGTLLLSVEQDKVLTSSVHKLSANTAEITVPMEGSMAPNVYVTASVIRPVKPAEKWLPHRAIGMASARVVPGERRLSATIEAPTEVRPLGALPVTITLRDEATSQPVSGDVFVWAVDEGVLTLTDFDTPDPFLFFTAPRRLMVETADFFSRLMPDLLNRVITPSATGGGDEAGGSNRLSPVASERVKPVVLWGGLLKTDAQGSATVTWQVPQFMGRLRVMAVAGAEAKFGSSSREVFVRSPLMIKEGVPRFLAPGDRAEVALTVYNNSAAELTPELSVVSTGPLVVKNIPTIGAIPPDGQLAVSSEVVADAEQIGTAVLELSARAGSESYETSVSLPIRPAAAYRKTGGVEIVKAGERRQVTIGSADMLPGSTTATLTVGGDPLLQLAGALDFNTHYPYGCAEQVISGLFPLLTLPELAQKVSPGRFHGDALKLSVQRGVDRLLMYQTASGGISTWPGRVEPATWTSIYGLHFLAEARRDGYEVPQEAFITLMDYCQTLIDNEPEKRATNSLTEQAYAAYAMGTAGRRVIDQMDKLFKRREELDASGRALLATAYKAQGLDQQAAALLSGARDAGAAPGATLDVLGSPAREKALLLTAYLDTSVDAREAAQLVQALVREQKNGHWGSTQANAFALWALGRYTRATSETALGSGRITGLTGMPDQDFDGSQPLHLSSAALAGSSVMIEGTTGTTYVYWSAGGVPRKPDDASISQGITVERKYLDREGNPVDTGNIRQGDLLVAEVSIGGNRDLNDVVIQDLLPAGLEPENNRLATSEQSLEAEEGSDDGGENGLIAERIDIRDDRVLAFVNLSKTDAGRQVFRYAVRAVTPGTYVVPAVQAEAMYDPAITARGSAAALTIQKR